MTALPSARQQVERINNQLQQREHDVNNDVEEVID
jgi:hypothetical protein